MSHSAAFRTECPAMPHFPQDQAYKHGKAARSIELYSINHSCSFPQGAAELEKIRAIYVMILMSWRGA